MVFLLSILVSFLLCFTAKCHELPPSAAVHVDPHHLKNVSHSVLAAENWLRNYVLAHYPASNVTTIVVGSTVVCSKHQQHEFALLLPSIKNIHYSLTRWGLQEEIKVSVALSSDCLQEEIKPLLAFLQEIASPYVVTPPHDFPTSSEEILYLHSKSINARRKLAYIDISNSRVNLSPPLPAFAAGSPLPPLVGSLPPQPNSHAPPPEWNAISPPFLPHLAPVANPPFGPHLPPCDPSRSAGHHGHGAWCVAKPSVPAETLQQGLDYACGDGNVDCEAIKEDGSCYYPDNLVAHASYAFNSYWQATKRSGGTCGFGGTAMLISSDPSYGHCRFALT